MCSFWNLFRSLFFLHIFHLLRCRSRVVGRSAVVFCRCSSLVRHIRKCRTYVSVPSKTSIVRFGERRHLVNTLTAVYEFVCMGKRYGEMSEFYEPNQRFMVISIYAYIREWHLFVLQVLCYQGSFSTRNALIK